MGWTETYRGTVHRWEVDNVDHFTVAYYFARFEDATAALLEAIGLGREGLVATARAAAVTECRVRYLRELRVGDVLHIRSGVIDGDGHDLILGHEVLDSSDGARCTTVEQRVALVDGVSGAPVPLGAGDRERARTRRVDWDGGSSGSTPAAPASAGADDADAAFLDTTRDTVKPWEIDARGVAAPPAFIHRFSAANAQLLAAFGMTPSYMRQERRGFSTFEFNLAFPGVLRAGDLVRVRSALTHIGNSSIRIFHRMTNAATNAVIATLEQSGVHLDLAARRPAPLPGDLRERAKTLLVGAGGMGRGTSSGTGPTAPLAARS